MYTIFKSILNVLVKYFWYPLHNYFEAQKVQIRHAGIQRVGVGGGGQTICENSKNKGFRSNTGPDSL